MPTSDNFEYKGWRVKVGRTGMQGAYDGEAFKQGAGLLYTTDYFGQGAKARATEAIKKRIDNKEAQS